MTTHRTWTSVLALAVIVMAALTGCSQLDRQGDRMTPYEAQAELMTLMDRIQTELGGEWESEDDSSPLPCDVRGGGEGVHFSFLRIGSSPGTMEDAEEAIATVTTILTEQRYEITESGLFGGDRYELTAVNSADGRITFGSSVDSNGMTGRSDCVPGDIDQILDDLEQQGL